MVPTISHLEDGDLACLYAHQNRSGSPIVEGDLDIAGTRDRASPKIFKFVDALREITSYGDSAGLLYLAGGFSGTGPLDHHGPSLPVPGKIILSDGVPEDLPTIE